MAATLPPLGLSEPGSSRPKTMTVVTMAAISPTRESTTCTR